MALEQKLSIRLGQRLVMTPSLQQAIKLLQMSKLELVEEVQQVGRSPTGAPATSPGRGEDTRGASHPAASSGLVEDIEKIGRLKFDSAGREIDPGKRRGTLESAGTR